MPAQLAVNIVVTVSADVVAELLVAVEPIGVPLGAVTLQLVVLTELHESVETPPLATVEGFATNDTCGAGAGGAACTETLHIAAGPCCTAELHESENGTVPGAFCARFTETCPEV